MKQETHSAALLASGEVSVAFGENQKELSVMYRSAVENKELMTPYGAEGNNFEKDEDSISEVRKKHIYIQCIQQMVLFSFFTQIFSLCIIYFLKSSCTF